VLDARIRLALLWLSQVARVMADYCLRVFVVLELARAGTAQSDAAWHLVLALFVLPAVVLTPVTGALSNSLPKRRVLAGSAAFCLAALVAFATADSGWLGCVVLVAVGAAVYSPTRYALLPAAAADTRLPLSRVNGWIEAGTVAAVIGGLVLGGRLAGLPWSPGVGTFAAGDSAGGWPGLPMPVAGAVGLNVLCVLAAVPVWFAADVRRREPPGQALASFFRDSRRILQDGPTRGLLLAWSGFRGLAAAATGAVVAATLRHTADTTGGLPYRAVTGTALWVLAGAAGGSLLAGVQGHPRRVLGIVPFGVTGLATALSWAALVSPPGAVLCVLVGCMGGLVNVPLGAAYQEALPDDARGNGLAVLNTAGYVLMAALAGLMAGLARWGVVTPAGQLGLVAALAAAGAVVAWRVLLREALEQFMEVVLWPVYRIRAHGPGAGRVPRRGPLLIVANHSSWFDPLWLGKVMPRPLIPMMTSVFYDLPVLRLLMTKVVHAIRVPSATFRREAPELREAVSVLDRGGCLVIFPEGMLRRRADQPLRRFGQGVWHILRERPATQVVVCWIEGGWGSYMSFCGGPPLTNKHPDWWRHIDIAVSEPQVLDASVLGDHLLTRGYLMEACLKARSSLGLEPVAPPDLAVVGPASGDEGEGEA
jgi:1-acyl-sn-glycerol-3-phosphate acyltransferase